MRPIRLMPTAAAAERLARWATDLEPSHEDLALARRSLLDTVAVMVAARADPLAELFGRLGTEVSRWAALAHVLDYDDLHMPSTTHISAVCAPTALACGGGARAYLAGAGVMARLGTALGWRHYQAGWHATCTAGAPAAAVSASVARGLDAERTAVAMALAVPAAGGVQRAFGTAAKALQVGFAAEAGVRAATLSEAGASADVHALDDWMALVGGEGAALDTSGPAVPNGLAIKLFPCCYALQRPIAAVVGIGPLPERRVEHIRVRTPACSLAPLIHHRPRTGLEGKFSLEYGIAAALLNGLPGIDSFNDEAVRRAEAMRLVEAVETVATEGGEHLLAGEIELEVTLADGSKLGTTLATAPGAPDRPPTDEELLTKLTLCAGAEADTLAALTWESAGAYLRSGAYLHSGVDRVKA
ncbi:MAG: MmgE/PrpD family protein [Solirubrobacterales bacterium]|nr:MmgE/PrpD family protein [Solirubrobacterales bacterium]